MVHMTRIQRYFNALADQIASRSALASTASHRPDIGTNREEIVRLFLSKHLPNRLSSTLGGQVISLSEAESNQIDVLVSNDIAVRFEENERTFVVAEGVAAAITVKSYLDGNAIEDSLLNLASIPQLNRRALDFKLLVRDPFSAFVEVHPTLCVFAYDGVQADSCLEHVTDFYRRHPEIPRYRYALHVIVNSRYTILYCRSEVTTTTGYVAQPGEFFLDTLEDNTEGYRLLPCCIPSPHTRTGFRSCTFTSTATSTWAMACLTLPQCVFHSRCRLVTHIGQHVTVDVERETHVAVA